MKAKQQQARKSNGGKNSINEVLFVDVATMLLKEVMAVVGLVVEVGFNPISEWLNRRVDELG